MKRIKEFVCDDFGIPTDTELMECINIAKSENCRVILYYTPPLSRTRTICIESTTTLEECKEVLNDYIMR